VAWTTITDTVLQVGRPIRALTMRLLRDNITALANGDAGAPKIQGAAFADNSINGEKIAVGTTNGNRLINYTVGSDKLISVAGAKLSFDPDFTYRVRLANSQAGVYDLGEYALVVAASGTPGWAIGSEHAGGNLRESSARRTADGTQGNPLTGTWRIVSYPGTSGAVSTQVFLAKRIA
jgi:hypothetical protein